MAGNGMVLKSPMCTIPTTMLFVPLVFVRVPEAQGQAAIGCTAVVQYLKPCLPYLTDKGPIYGECCTGVKALDDAANTPEDRQSVCSCLKSLDESYPTVDKDKASGLPGQCGVNNIPYKISLSTDCSTVH